MYILQKPIDDLIAWIMYAPYWQLYTASAAAIIIIVLIVVKFPKGKRRFIV